MEGSEPKRCLGWPMICFSKHINIYISLYIEHWGWHLEPDLELRLAIPVGQHVALKDNVNNSKNNQPPPLTPYVPPEKPLH